MKRSGSPAGCGTERVLDLDRGDAELGDECLDCVSDPESLKQVAQSCAAMSEDWLTERPARIDHDLGLFIGREVYEARVPVACIFDPLQIALYDGLKYALTASDNH